MKNILIFYFCYVRNCRGITQRTRTSYFFPFAMLKHFFFINFLFLFLVGIYPGQKQNKWKKKTFYFIYIQGDIRSPYSDVHKDLSWCIFLPFCFFFRCKIFFFVCGYDMKKGNITRWVHATHQNKIFTWRVKLIFYHLCLYSFYVERAMEITHVSWNTSFLLNNWNSKDTKKKKIQH